ncbi:sugar phosphate isomerase/epimerase [Frankia sp. CNm7]|uniref:Sugar phosphate isomerase/epimerase n=1 Tax=Frankia nepalensis TaxID=1836974 RepID=A0A937UPS0_9ACTN|nr:TIM barrel protein [Frankia nepalensis]MBL7496552.1 sugar phosphate isomerase/epimerase [Frankia nepalensis]MBL7508771.1 sugar phosphate isomerase/epimerase [Frankia nepalensis]MBL7520602.1 sugar phosphate isomerase/epimerase [Frankia nepalensis]MBL7627525.1 sugar phosphate isomerase/epimerase [Frankia nepalensis]
MATVELALSPDTMWDVDIDAMAGATRAAGFSALGLAIIGGVDEKAAAALDTSGLRCHELMALLFTGREDVVLRHAAKLAGVAAAVRAEWIVATFLAPLGGQSLDLLKRSTDIFAEAGARLAVEPSPLGGVASIDDALEVVEAAGPDRAGVLIDSWHFFRGGAPWEQLERVPLDRVAYVQMADALPPASEDAVSETANRRALPGHGVLDLDRFAGTLRDRGYDGLVSVEVLNEELRRDPLKLPQAAMEATAPYWR